MNLTKHLIILTMGAMSFAPIVSQAQTTYPRGMVIEQFTGQLCSGCAAAPERILQAIEGQEDNPRVVWVAHHAGNYPDSLTIKPSVDLMSFMGVYAVPIMTFNRTPQAWQSIREKLLQSVSDFAEYNSLFAQYDADGRTFVEAQLDERADISVDMDVTYDRDTRHLKVKVYGERNTAFDAQSPALTLFLLQDDYVGMQFLGAGQYDMAHHHYNAPRLMLTTDFLGDAIEFDGDGRYVMEYECDVPETVEPYDNYGIIVGAQVPLDDTRAHVAAIISNHGAANTECPVYNAVRCPLGNNSTSSAVAGHAADDTVRVYAADGRVVIEGEYDRCTVYDTSGRIADGENLSRGLYLVRVTAGDATQTHKVLID